VRRRREGAGISLFPFLSILACIIGTLTLMLAGLSAGTVADEEGPGRAAEYEALQRESEALRSELLELNRPDPETTELTRELAAARKDRALLAQGKRSTRATQAKLEASERERSRLRGAVSAARRDLETNREEARRLRREIEIREESLLGTQLRSSGSGVGLKPHFVECTKVGIILAPDRTDGAPIRLTRLEIKGSRAYRLFLRRAKDQANGTVIFLIRDEGVSSFDPARQLAADFEVRHGFLPVPGTDPIGFAHVRRDASGD